MVLSSDASSVVKDVGQTEFNRLFAACPVVQYTRNAAVYSVYARKSAIPANFDAYTLFTYLWASADNQIGTDFLLYDNVDDARFGTGAWTSCNYDDPDVGFPRDCGKNGYVGSAWFSLPGGAVGNMRGINSGSGFAIYTGDNCPATGWATNSPTNAPTTTTTTGAPTVEPTPTAAPTAEPCSDGCQGNILQPGGR